MTHAFERVDRFQSNDGDIHKIIDNSLSLDFTIDTNNINNIIEFQNLYYNKLTDKILKKL